MTSFLFLIAGLVCLGVASDALVNGAAATARRFHIPPIIIGLTVVAMGTSAPEAIVSIQAALSGAPGLAVGNVVGSNIANILLVLGLPAVIFPIAFGGDGVRRPAVFMTAVSILFVWLSASGMLTRLDGLLLLAVLTGYLLYSGLAGARARSHTLEARNHAAAIGEMVEPIEQMPPWRMTVLIVLGAIGLGIGSTLTIEGATGIAQMLGVSDTVIGLSIVAAGTSLPELAASVTAAIRRQHGLTIGNVLGSNIFNALGILGLTSLIVPLQVPRHIVEFDFWVMLGTSLAVLPFAFWIRRIGRLTGLVMLFAYGAYVFAVFQSSVIT
jgi:cation:H+ antiporter